MVSVFGLLFAFFGFLANPFGLLALFLGVFLFIVIPIVPKITNYYHSFARLHLFVATRMLKRAAFVVSEHGDLLLKRMTPDDIGTEKISFADDVKEFEDPTNALHWWHGIPFALADEAHGILFDPRHAAAGKQEHDLERNNETVFKPTSGEQEQHEIIAWQHAVYEFARDTYEIVDLGMVRELVTGSERAEHPGRVKTFYENSRVVYDEGSSTARWVLIIAAAIAPFAAMWLIADRLMQGSTSTLGFNLLVLLLSGAGVQSYLDDVDWHSLAKFVLVSTVIWLPLPLLFVALYTIVNPMFAVLTFVVLGMGFWFIPVFCLLFRVSTTFTDWASGFLFRLGFMGYDQPIFEWTPRKYQIRERSKLGNVDEEDAAWYGVAGNLLGFTWKPGPDSWSMGHLKNSELANATLDPHTDTAESTNIPTQGNSDDESLGKYRIWPELRRDVYAAVVPADVSDDKHYLNSGIIQEAFTYAATGNKSAERLTQAKDEFGEDHGMDEGRFGMTLALTSVVSLAAGVLVFFT